MQLCNENIESVYVMPGFLNFEHDCLTILRRSMIAVAPEEGCALLLGNQKNSAIFPKKIIWNVSLIWPCCNAWEPGFFNLDHRSICLSLGSEQKLTRENRFALDPREQLLAQRWARANNLEIIGTAHSHPEGDAYVSDTDLRWGMSPGLMVIVAKNQLVRAWWKNDSQSNQLQPVQLAHSS